MSDKHGEERMPTLDSEWYDKAHRTQERKTTHLPNGVARPATERDKQRLIEEWTHQK